MTEILLIRHGQASLGGPTYDQLSELGYQQAHWLAQHLQTQQQHLPLPTQLLSGAMARQKQTAAPIADGLQQPQTETFAGFNEFDFEAVVMAFLTLNPGYPLNATPTKPELYQLLSLAMRAWAENSLAMPESAESWLGFHARVAQTWQNFSPIVAGRAIIVTSAGVIASIVRQVMGLDDLATIRLNLQIKNSSVTKLFYDGADYHLSSFNLVSHLEQSDRYHAITSA